ncbi:uncharacterized protein L969DRAFT_84622 [Mixia osmundae IAM 14324]|uniref:Rsm22-cox11 tandem protein 1, mitochondrial n=1 Tax=Mixia osmundae (strain CBS 9802 / IAM 14324 / JCM 22182 / KY 12970) TaxID=764103 RepID=G7DT41_MIXOS|nr:uncharacterized protein L969DRAFT_84622 [Mixia osmundae IAM 14324]KEI42747.1 hypothetical protein L969DRAFT_84622 [Mixia osmundae IAM 14324]GAA93920.1 hypothetical protein E5Q_00566 [Mixia osmundae IAM 14324]
MLTCRACLLAGRSPAVRSSVGRSGSRRKISSGVAAIDADSLPDRFELLDDDQVEWLNRAELARPTIRRSAQAKYGSAQSGQIDLPLPLQQAVTQLVQESDRPLLRQDALKLYARMGESSRQGQQDRKKGRLPRDQRSPASVRDQRTKMVYDHRSALAYAAGVMPSVYAATQSVLQETRKRLEASASQAGWRPGRIIDFGSGTASTAWAANAVWPEHKIAYTALDASPSMTHTAAKLLAYLPDEHLDRSFHTTRIPTSDSSSITQNAIGEDAQHTLAISAFALDELGSTSDRRDCIRAMWESGAQVIVLIERGTAKGFMHIAKAREQLLNLGRRRPDEQPLGADDPVESDADVLHIGGNTLVADDAKVPDGSALQAEGSYVVAPCPHDGECPLHREKDICHFSQRVSRPSYLRRTKHARVGEEDSKFSYVVIRRGPRPSHAISEARQATTREEDVQLSQRERHDAMAWPRLLYPPMKRSGHVIMDVCSSSGHIERMIIAKSAGRQAYYDARKSSWGDAFPHASRTPPVVKSFDGAKRLHDFAIRATGSGADWLAGGGENEVADDRQTLRQVDAVVP